MVYIASVGDVERNARILRRNGYLQNALLSAVAVAGALAVTALAPNTLQLLGKTRMYKRFKEQAQKSTTRLINKGYLSVDTIEGEKFLVITEMGRRALDRAVLESAVNPQKWDGRWRMIVFDIPERRRATRNHFRQLVSSFGFLKIQGSVWVYPFDCEELIVLLKAELLLGKDLLYAVVESIENDGWMREHFEIKKR